MDDFTCAGRANCAPWKRPVRWQRFGRTRPRNIAWDFRPLKGVNNMKAEKLLWKPRFHFRLSIYEAIRNSVGQAEAECGGLLGGDLKRGVVTHFYLDTGARRSRVTYTPAIETINDRLKEWDKTAVRLMGFVHSHPSGSIEPSGGDLVYATRILAANPSLPSLLVPIVTSSADAAEFALHLFVATRRGADVNIKRAQLVILEELSPVAARS